MRGERESGSKGTDSEEGRGRGLARRQEVRGERERGSKGTGSERGEGEQGDRK